MKEYAIGIDIGGTSVKMGIFNRDGDILARWKIPTDRSCRGNKILPNAASSIKDTLREMDIPQDDIQGAAAGLPGAVTGSDTVHGCGNLGWGTFNAAAELEALLGGIKVTAVNDANAAALGEMWKGGAAGYRNLVMVTLGTGVGGGIVVDGKVVEGAFGAAGEIGHICLNDGETAACGCGKRGHLEQYASATGIVRLTKTALENDSRQSPLRKIKDLTAKDIFDAARNGDGIAAEQVEALGKALGRSLAMISCVIDPQVYIIGGGVSGAGDILIGTIKKYYKKYAFHNSEETLIKPARLGNDAGIYGAAYLVFNN